LFTGVVGFFSPSHVLVYVLICRDDIEEKAAARVDAESKFAAADDKLKRAKESLKKHKERCESEARLVDNNGQDLPLKALLVSIDVDSVDEAKQAIEEAKEKVTAYAANPAVIKLYEKLKDEVSLLQEDVQKSSSNQGERAGQIQMKSDDFLQSMEGKLRDVDGRFSKYMAEMGCTGTLRLKKGGEEGNEGKDFKNWGLEILVSFREGSKAQVLSAQRHSGGERSVSTIMFLMALQDLMVAPFRTVDEINQGLDDRNERLVFRRIVQNSTAPPGESPTDHSGQYFLITPKLLPNLTDMENEAMTILFVFNGPYIFETPTQWKEFLAKKAAAAKPIASDDAENQESNNEGSVPRHSKKKRVS
jgi:structural maintenance of chromosomes protein 5